MMQAMEGLATPPASGLGGDSQIPSCLGNHVVELKRQIMIKKKKKKEKVFPPCPLINCYVTKLLATCF